jgi:hypothetical protein
VWDGFTSGAGAGRYRADGVVFGAAPALAVLGGCELGDSVADVGAFACVEYVVRGVLFLVFARARLRHLQHHFPPPGRLHPSAMSLILEICVSPYCRECHPPRREFEAVACVRRRRQLVAIENIVERFLNNCDQESVYVHITRSLHTSATLSQGSIQCASIFG